MKKKVLFVVTRYYPDTSAGAVLVTRICEQMAKCGIDVDVYVSDDEKHTEDTVSSINGVQVYRCVNKYWLDLKENGFRYFKSRYVGRLLARILYAEKTFSYYWISNQKHTVAKMCTKKKYSAVFSFCYAFENHRIAEYACHVAHRKWCPCYMDPYFTNQQNSTGKYMHRKLLMEKALLRQASKILLCDFIYQDYIRNGLPINSKKYLELFWPSLMENLYSKEKVLAKDSSSHKVTLLFAGSLYKKIRSPDYTFKLVQALKDINAYFRCVGTVDKKFGSAYFEMWNKRCDGRIEMIGQLPQEEMQQEMKAADILVNIGNTTINQCPSKIIEYISTGKPIINIVKSSDCPTLKILSVYPRALSIVENEDVESKQLRQIEEFITKQSTAFIQWEIIKELFEPYIPETVAKVFIHCADDN